MTDQKFTHLDAEGSAHMVDVGGKSSSARQAIAVASVQTTPEVVAKISAQAVAKGDVLAVARVAGIMAAKRTSDLLPLCHPLALTKVSVDFTLLPEQGQIEIRALCAVQGVTGVEMEALTAVSVAALTIHDMCKAIDPSLQINGIQLQEKTGGKHGHWQRKHATHG
ncbi:cyclic pyranopterin monophosphate synthase MoaC [Pseudidiomarina terrestris]|uniref:Cyclic pyranopterin monophosphate synthase n=1 Tax=Pseudidiomarina terrestris TaxID=2820060 RepID=A0AAW7QX50_9GAMM|nr:MULTISPECIES: cyclic pyranopterin monophosphate synthase MoaC [unclassified Pseudidiomarina]MDN7124736.1 cyclic pyranopterin monophosphate synthase MoaC [Pseudidiomarina sp. 1APP75-32.1]MDN7125793.1 cyclic pyranopterin monophosphate synthase MoaC [Pseudidiomarina sp. 1APR75-33.1]MDN7129790.1 cyclic pyranopterin monophosphate synthase MoaC [Pseudidiomarina sp. 1APR75-15]MDN7136433.1 cyclic pyranopterin monophosphate synthase MoaC [Pseudidiomarina sp. 1ASP75-5]MDN7137953.1 cyclic pyranopterin